MKEYLKKVVGFTLCLSFNIILFHYIDFSNNSLGVTIDLVLIIGMISLIVIGILAVGVLKFISSKLNNDLLYDFKFICYLALINGSVILLSFFFPETNNDLTEWLIAWSAFGVYILVLYYFWKYRLEIFVGNFLMQVLHKKTELININKSDELIDFLQMYLPVSHISKRLEGMILLIFLLIFVYVAHLLRKAGVYNYGSNKKGK